MLTDNEIIKAWECCNVTGLCNECPAKRNIDVCNNIDRLTIDLINRQKAEIERLQKDRKRLKKVQMQLDDLCIMHNIIKAEAVKEFAERLKDMSEHFWEEKENFVSEETIDNLVKEMVGE